MDSRNTSGLERISLRTIMVTGLLVGLVYVSGCLTKHYKSFEKPAIIQNATKPKPPWYNPGSFVSSNSYRKR